MKAAHKFFPLQLPCMFCIHDNYYIPGPNKFGSKVDENLVDSEVTGRVLVHRLERTPALH